MEKEFCCEAMQYHAANHCDIHDDPFDCPDCLIYHNEKTQQFGIIIHDGGQSFVEITHCPWCGQDLTRRST